MSIKIENLSYAYEKNQVLCGINTTIHEGSLTALFGPNGSGKSTLFKCILGLCKGYGGKIYINGTDASLLNVRQKSKQIAYIPQTHNTVFGYSVLDMVIMGTAHQVSSLSSPSEKELRQARAAMEKVGIEHLSGRSINRLSGGEQQLVLIARALAQSAKILLMDEPTSALDYGNQLLILRQAEQLRNEGYTVLMSSHNPQHVMNHSDRTIAMFGGKIVADDVTESVLTPELIQKLYGVKTIFSESEHGKSIMPL